jgi:hypothetical protein
VLEFLTTSPDVESRSDEMRTRDIYRHFCSSIFIMYTTSKFLANKLFGMEHNTWEFTPFDADAPATADGPLPEEEEGSVPDDILPTLEYAQLTPEQQV